MLRPRRPRVPATLAVLTAAWSLLPGAAAREVDHRFSPPTWHVPLGLPDDWHKPMADDRGALLLDFGPGPYALPLTMVGFGLDGQRLAREHQRFDSPRTPVLRTTLSAADGGRVEITTLSAPPASIAGSDARFARYERLDGISGALGWAQPAEACSPEFRNVAWGTNRPLRYRVRVEPGARRRIVLGFCESYKPRLHERVAALHVEGSPLQTADLALTAARHTPQVFEFAAADQDRNGWIDVTVAAVPGGDPNTTLALIAVYAADARYTRDTLIAGSRAPADPAELRIDCGAEVSAQPGRVDAMHAEFPAGSAPVLTVRTGRPLQVDGQGGLASGDRPFLATHPRAARVEQSGDRWTLHFPAGTRRATALVYSGSFSANAIPDPALFDFAAAVAEVTGRWRATDVPFGRVTVGDPEIQRVVDASLRNIYQARERLNGAGQFNSSFTLYRGLWAGDAVYMIELAALLGDFGRARETLDTLFSFQNAEGLIDELPPSVLYRATPAVFWALERYARLSGDWAAVERHWPGVRRGVDALRRARDSTLTTPGAANAGLLPAGFNDGGIAEIGSEYSSVFWAITGLRATARAARQLGRSTDAIAADQLAGEFERAFATASARDLRTDPRGHRYLPVRVGRTGPDEIPQLAQWAVLEHHLFGEGLPLGSPLLHGTLAMLEAAETEGLPHSVGWLRDGLWVGYGSLYAHLPLLLGRDAKAADLLYSIANHAAPAGSWVEEQSLQGAPPRTAGDQPHVWAATLFVRLALSFLACERAGVTHLLLATPPEWLRPGAENRLDGVRVTGGPLTLALRVAPDGRSATLDVAPPASGEFTLHTRSLRAAGFSLAGGEPTPDTLPVRAGVPTHLRFVR
jgi:hypothetical protein